VNITSSLGLILKTSKGENVQKYEKVRLPDYLYKLNVKFRMNNSSRPFGFAIRKKIMADLKSASKNIWIAIENQRNEV